MPNRGVEFIGREREFELISKAVFDWGTKQALFVYGPGGVGKTSLLRRVHEQLSGQLAHPPGPGEVERRYRILNIIDLDDIRLQSPLDISLAIIDQVGMEGFGRYVRELQVLQELEQMTSVRIPEQKRKVEDVFVECYTDIFHDVRTVIFCDTTDAVKNDYRQEVLNYLFSLSQNLSDTVVVFSGRNSKELYKSFSQGSESVHTHLLPIEPLRYEDCCEYLQRKQELLHIVIDPETAQKILFMSRGLPFLIDLAAEWLAREMPPPWFIEETPKTLRLMPGEEAKERQKDFEACLVRPIAQLRSPFDRLALVLAWVHPVDSMLCAELLDLSEEQAAELIADARNVPFVKTLPDEQIKLHDYMETLVLKHVWRNIEEERRERDSRRAAHCFESKLQELFRQREALRSALSESREGPSDPLDVFLREEILERKYWQTASQLVKYTLVTDANRGADTACDLFDEAYDLHRISDCERLITPVIGNKNVSPEQQIEALIRRGNVRIRLRRKQPMQAALGDFREAIQIAQTNELLGKLGRAEIEAGWAYSSIGNWDEANGHFEEALELALEMKDQELEATVLNELAYTRSYEDPTGAISLCDEAIKMWIELGNKRGLGLAYSNMGTLLYRAADYDRAQEYFPKARGIFESAGNLEWVSILSSWQGITYWAQAERDPHAPEVDEQLRKAEELLTRAVDIGVHRERARNLNRLARVYRSQGRYDEAWHQLLKAYDASIEVGDFIYEIASLRDISSMALELEKFDTYDDLKAKLAKCEARDILPEGLGYGGALINIGIMGTYLGDNEFGFRSIAHGLKRSAESGGYADHSFVKTLEAFQKYVVDWVAPSERRELADYLKRYWENEGLSRKYVEATRAFYKI